MRDISLPRARLFEFKLADACEKQLRPELLFLAKPLPSTNLQPEAKMMRLPMLILATAGVIATAAMPVFAGDNMQTSDEFRTSKLVGTKVYNNANENIGSIEDIILKSDGSMDEVVLSVGGFLGMGDKYVAVPFSSLKLTRNGGGLKIVTDGTKDSLKAQPDYQFFKS